MEQQQENILQSQDKIPSSSKEVHCNYCPRRFTEQRDLVRHISIIHHKEFNKEENDYYLFPSHTLVLHCKYCGRRFTEHKSLAQHVEVVHHNIRSFSCDSCKKAFASKQEMVRHSEKGC